MAFKRAYSKVWWSEYDSGSVYDKQHNRIEVTRLKEELSQVIEETTQEYESPGSLRSQDSGFSDNDESGNKKIVEKSPSISSTKTIETPPTVIRRKVEEFSSNVSRRISFSASSSPIQTIDGDEIDIFEKINRLSLINNTPDRLLEETKSGCKCSKDRSIRRRRMVNKSARKSLVLNRTFENPSELYKSESEDDDYKNEAINSGYGDSNNNFSKNCSSSASHSLSIRECLQPAVSTSTPKKEQHNDSSLSSSCDLDSFLRSGITLPYYGESDINPSVQSWLNEIRLSYNHEVMSTLQTKSIAQEAFRNLKITTSTVSKIVRQLQTRALIFQGEFDRIEKFLQMTTDSSFKDALSASEGLILSVIDFVQALERRSVFFIECRSDKKIFEDNVEHIKHIAKDLKISLERQHYLDAEALYEDINVLERYVLLTIRLVFEKLIRVILLNIEHSKCDLMLRANLNMVATLSNTAFTGLASLQNAFVKNDSVRILLLICLDSKFSSVRALALRALATICSNEEAIQQFELADGLDIIKDIISCRIDNAKKTEPEKREAVSLLTQVTAPWHGTNHRLNRLKECVESLIEGLTDMIQHTNCCQTLLLCAASFNNLTRLEPTSIYSIMSNESVIKLKEAIDSRGPGVSIFLYAQIAEMLYNMSGNKKCHSHLANRNIINLITSIFQSQFYVKFETRAENEAHHRTIKTILHILSRLIHDSVVGQEILEHNFVPIFSRIEENSSEMKTEYRKDISFISRKLNESVVSHQNTFNSSSESRRSSSSSSSNSAKVSTVKQESYV